MPLQWMGCLVRIAIIIKIPEDVMSQRLSLWADPVDPFMPSLVMEHLDQCRHQLRTVLGKLRQLEMQDTDLALPALTRLSGLGRDLDRRMLDIRNRMDSFGGSYSVSKSRHADLRLGDFAIGDIVPAGGPEWPDARTREMEAAVTILEQALALNRAGRNDLLPAVADDVKLLVDFIAAGYGMGGEMRDELEARWQERQRMAQNSIVPKSGEKKLEHSFSAPFVGSIASKIIAILYGRFLRKHHLGQISALLWGSDWVWGEKYIINDDLGEMATDNVRDKMSDFYVAIAKENKVGEDWTAIDIKNVSVKKMIGQIKMTGRNDGLDFGRKTYWWIGGSHDVFANGRIEARWRKDNRYEFKNIDVNWIWIDRIDANSYIELWRGGQNKPTFVVEGAYDLWVDGFLDLDFDVEIHFADKHDGPSIKEGLK